MADVEQERVTALWREAAARLEDAWTYSEEPVSSLHIGPCAECGRLQEQLDAARKVSARLRVNSIAWHCRFHTGRWQDCAEPSCVTDRAARAALGVVGEETDDE